MLEEMLASIKKGDIQDIKFQTKHRDLFLVSITFVFLLVIGYNTAFKTKIEFFDIY